MQMPAPFEELVEELVSDVVDSFEKLEILLALAASDKPLPMSAIAAAAHIDERVVRDECAELVDAAALVRTDDASGAPTFSIDRNGPWSKHVDALRALYDANRMKVITLMSDAALKRLRDKADRIFADAFIVTKLRKDRDK